MAEQQSPLVHVGKAGGEDAALSRPYAFMRLQAPGGAMAETANHAPRETGPMRMRAVLEQQQAVLVAQGPESVQLGGLAPHVGDHDGFGLAGDRCRRGG